MEKAKILIVEDTEEFALYEQKSLEKLEYVVNAIASSGEEAVEKTARMHPDLVLMDITLKGNMDGIEAAKQIRTRFDIPVVYLTASTDIKTMERAKVSGPFGYIIKPFDINTLYINIEMALYKHQLESKVRKSEEELQLTLAKLRKTLGGTINAMALTVESKDPYTAGHQRRVADLARAVATEMCLPKEKIEGIRMAGVIHDLGKISVPAEILSKPGRITDIEFNLIKTHPQTGYDILKTIEFPWPVAQIVLQHHERMNGSGYPLGLSGENILMEARILAVADVVEAMFSHRPYRIALGIEKALEEISQNKGVLYDPEAVDACLKLFKEKRFEFRIIQKSL